MDWEQLEEHWRDVKCHITGAWGCTKKAVTEGEDDWVTAPVRNRRHAVLQQDSVFDEEEWNEFEASVLKDDLDQLIREFESTGSHH